MTAPAVSIVFPFRAGCLYRERAFDWCRAWWAEAFPEFEQIVGESPDGPFSRSAAMLDGAARAEGEVLVFADTDVWCEPAAVLAAIDAVSEHGWAVPHRLLHRLSPESSDLFMAGHPLEGLELSSDNSRDMSPYVGNATGTLLVTHKNAFTEAPPDPRFRGWGQEDNAWWVTLQTLVGSCWRGDADLVHLWHPPAERSDRKVGNPVSLSLWRRYRKANNHPDVMRALINEWRVDADPS